METMGWKIFRIWSTDWFRNPKQELERLVAAVEKAMELTAQGDIDDEAQDHEVITVNREKGGEVKSSLPPYVLTKLPAEVGLPEMHLHSFAKLAGWITDVVKTEGPVHLEEMTRRMADAARISKVNSRVKYTITQATQYALDQRMIKAKGDFLWPVDIEQPTLRDRSALPSTSKKLEYIAPEEIDLAIQKVVEEAIGIQPEAAVSFIAKMLGFARLTEDLKNDILHHIDLSLEKGSVIEDGEFLKAN
jgi:hypothetical protein